MSTDATGFKNATGQWLGTAEVYDGNGRFLGNGTDQRHVQKIADSNRIRIDLSFIGPFKFAGYYEIEDHGAYRLYQGPANTGYAESLGTNLVDANGYWPVTGLSHRFFLMILPDGNRQLSLALMSRGEQLLYVVVGENQRVTDGRYNPTLLNGTSYDLADDPSGGRGEILLHRAGQWTGTLQTLNANMEVVGENVYRESITTTDDGLQMTITGSAFNAQEHTIVFKTNKWQAWSGAGDVVGSYSLSGGRALSGQFHHLIQNLRLWRREVVSHDGLLKAAVHIWYRGGQRIGAQVGVLHFN